jgi:hypothetical protein
VSPPIAFRLQDDPTSTFRLLTLLPLFFGPLDSFRTSGRSRGRDAPQGHRRRGRAKSDLLYMSSADGILPDRPLQQRQILLPPHAAARGLCAHRGTQANALSCP